MPCTRVCQLLARRHIQNQVSQGSLQTGVRHDESARNLQQPLVQDLPIQSKVKTVKGGHSNPYRRSADLRVGERMKQGYVGQGHKSQSLSEYEPFCKKDLPFPVSWGPSLLPRLERH